MAVRVSKSSFNIREKLTELGRRFGLKGSQLAAAETVQEARDLVSAGRRNKIINGDFQVNQRDNLPLSVSTNNTNIHCLDRFQTGVGIDAHTGTSAVLNYEHVDGPTELGFRYAFKITVTTAGVTQTTNQDTQLTETNLETSTLHDLGYGTSSAKPMTLSFYVRSSAPGKYGMFIYRPTGPRQFVAGYDIKTANVWQKVEIIIPGDTAQALSTTASSEGIRIEWRASCSGNSVGSPMTGWGAVTNQRSVTGNIDLLAIQDATWELTGVQLEVGKNATEFEHRSYGEELALCQRYFRILQAGRVFVIGSGGNNAIGANINHPVTMRTSPTPTFYGGNSTSGNVRVFSAEGGSQANYDSSASNMTGAQNGGDCFGFNMSTFSPTLAPTASGWIDLGTATNNLKIEFSAEF